MQKSILFAAEEVNAAGGAAGRQFVVFSEDDQTSPDPAVLATKKLLEVNKVDAVLGQWSSAVALAIMPFLQPARKIQMVTGGASEVSTKDQYDLVWRFTTTSERLGEALAVSAAKDPSLRRAAVLNLNNPSPNDGASGFIKRWKALGREVTTSIVYEMKQASYRSELQKALATKPDLIANYGFMPDATILLREWYEAGGSQKWISPGFAVNPKLVEAVGHEVAEGVMAVNIVSDEEAATFQHFSKKYQQLVGAPVGDNSYAAGCYDMVITLALAIEAAGPNADNMKIVAKIREVVNPPGEKVYSFAEGKKLLQAGKKINYEGASGPLDFDDKGDPLPVYSLDVIQKGKFVRSSIVRL